MSEQSHFDPSATMRAPHVLKREWGDDEAVDPTAQTIEINPTEIRSKHMDWYPGKDAGKGMLALTGLEVTPPDQNLSDVPRNDVALARGWAAQDAVDDTEGAGRDKHPDDQTYVFKTGEDGEPMAIPIDEYWEMKKAKRAAEEAKALEANDIVTDDMKTGYEDTVDTTDQERLNDQQDQATALELKEKRDRLQAELNWVRDGLDSIMSRIPEENKTNFHWAAVHYGHALDAGEDKDRSELHLSLHQRELSKLPDQHRGHELFDYMKLMREQAQIDAKLRAL